MKGGLVCLFQYLCYHLCQNWSMRKLSLVKILSPCSPPSKEPEEILSDRKPNGKERPWKTYKRLGTFLYQLYGRAREIDESCISPSAYFALERCCSWLLFRRYVEGSVLKLHKADFCRHRLCPVCNWRKSLKLFSQMKDVSARLLQDFPGARYLFLTLTVKNCSGAELAQTIDKMNFGFQVAG